VAKSKAQLEAENRILRQSRVAEGIISVLQAAIRWGAIVCITRYIYLTISKLAGQQTSADIGVGFLADVNVSVFVAWTLGSAGVIYGYYQNRLRKDTVERLQGRIQALELKLDPNRSSSRLTKRGDTRPEDQL
jgi:hypothetical protein